MNKFDSKLVEKQITKIVADNKILAQSKSALTYDKNGNPEFIKLDYDADHVAFMINTFNGIEPLLDGWTGKYRKSHQLGTAIINAMMKFGFVRHGSIVAFYHVVQPTAKSNLNNLSQWRKNFIDDAGIDCVVSKSPKMFINDPNSVPN